MAEKTPGRTLLTFHKPRFLCRDCGRSFFVRPPFVVPGMSVTAQVLLEIVSELTSTLHSVTDIAKATHTSPAIVLNVMHRIALNKPSRLPETIGIDEFHGKTGTYNRKWKRYDTEKYHCVITCPDDGCVADILFKATFRELHDYFMEYPLWMRQDVRYFCTDMRSGFSKVARACFPNAKICIDPFHVIKLLTEAVNDARIAEWDSLLAKADAKKAEAKKAKENSDSMLSEDLRQKSNALLSDAAVLRCARKLLVTSPYNEDAYWNRNEQRRDERLSEIYSIAPCLEEVSVR